MVIALGDYFYAEKISKKTNVNKKIVEEFLISLKEKIICLKGNNDFVQDFKNLNIQLYNDYYTTEIDQHVFLFTHGDRLKKILSMDADIYIYGHEHKYYINEQEDIVFACVGSISLPVDDYEESYGIYENNHLKIKTLSGKTVAEKKWN